MKKNVFLMAGILLLSLLLLPGLSGCGAISSLLATPTPTITSTPTPTPTPTITSTPTLTPFTIKNESFAASNACDGEGVLEFKTENGDLTATARGDIKTFMRQSGLPSAWCHGFRHVWIGESTYAGYTFNSDPDDPLQFVVDRDKGYYYEQGTGTVTLPNGSVVTLP